MARNYQSLRGGRQRRRQGKGQRDADAEHQRNELSAALLGDHVCHFFLGSSHKHRGREEASRRRRNSLSGEQTQRRASWNSRNTQQDKLEQNQNVQIFPLRPQSPQGTILLHPAGNGDLQHIVNHKSGRQQYQCSDQHHSKNHIGKTALRLTALSTLPIADAHHVQECGVILDAVVGNSQRGNQIVYGSLKTLSVGCAQVCGIG